MTLIIPSCGRKDHESTIGRPLWRHVISRAERESPPGAPAIGQYKELRASRVRDIRLHHPFVGMPGPWYKLVELLPCVDGPCIRLSDEGYCRDPVSVPDWRSENKVCTRGVARENNDHGVRGHCRGSTGEVRPCSDPRNTEGKAHGHDRTAKARGANPVAQGVRSQHRLTSAIGCFIAHELERQRSKWTAVSAPPCVVEVPPRDTSKLRECGSLGQQYRCMPERSGVSVWISRESHADPALQATALVVQDRVRDECGDFVVGNGQPRSGTDHQSFLAQGDDRLDHAVVCSAIRSHDHMLWQRRAGNGEQAELVQLMLIQ
jgi:hypothetical protein